MIQETNFNDIRRNFMLASIILILFLLYWKWVTIEQILIFKFHTDWTWAKIDPYWDLFIILHIFFFYTLARYLIYWEEKINENKYNRIKLIEFLKNLSLENWKNLKDKIESITQKETAKNREFSLLINDCKYINIDFNHYNDGLYLWIFAQDNQNVQLLWGRYPIPLNWDSIILSRKSFSFDCIDVVFKDKTIWNNYWPSFFWLIRQKEFSDYWWPLILILPIVLLLLLKIYPLIDKAFWYFYCF